MQRVILDIASSLIDNRFFVKNMLQLHHHSTSIITPKNTTYLIVVLPYLS